MSLMKQTRCLTETFFDRALQRARELDSEIQKTGTPVGPLHGLPISFKVRKKIAHNRPQPAETTYRIVSTSKGSQLRSDSRRLSRMARPNPTPPWCRFW